MCTAISKKNFFLFVSFYFAIALLLLIFTPITHKEAFFLYTHKFSLTTFVVQKIYTMTHSLIAIRLPFFIASSLSIIFFFKLAKIYIQKEEFVYLSALVFLLTPGFFVSFIVANYASITIFLLLLTLYLIEKDSKFLMLFPLMLLFFSSTAQFAFFSALFFYAFFHKKIFLAIVSFLLFGISLFFDRYEIGGIPRGHLAELFAVYAVIFSPFYLLALIYALYRFLVKERKNLIWYVTFNAFVFSLLLSIRQKISVTDFSVYMVIGAILVVMVFQKSIQIRLPQFRAIYKRVCQVIIVFLFLETFLIALNYPIYKISNHKIAVIDSSIYTIYKMAKEKKCIKKFQKRHENLYRYYHLQKCK